MHLGTPTAPPTSHPDPSVVSVARVLASFGALRVASWRRLCAQSVFRYGMMCSVFCVFLVSLSAFAVAQEGAPSYRAKINAVDVREAPWVKIRATLLNAENIPINPELIDRYDVSINDKRLPRERVDLHTWVKEDDPTDLVFVMPALESFNQDGKKAVSNAIKEMVKGMAPEDRVALVVYTRAVKVLYELSTVKDVAAQFYEKSPQAGVRPFMFSSLNKAISVLETSPKNRKKSIIYVGDGTDATTNEVDKLNQKLKEVITRARKSNIGIWTISYTPSPRGLDPTNVRTLQLLSRKTGATYRRSNSLRELLLSMDDAAGEIIGELVLKLRWDFDENKVYDFKVLFQSAKSPEIETPVYKQKVGKLKINWWFWGFMIGFLCLLSFIGFIAMILLVRAMRRRKAQEEAERELANLLRPKDDPEAEKKAPPKFVYDDKSRKVCNVCGRQVRQDAPECPYHPEGLDPLPEWVDQKRKEAALLGE